MVRHTRFDPEKQEPDFTYSTGFFHGLGHPEIIVFSLPKQVSHDILWDIYSDIREGEKSKTGDKALGYIREPSGCTSSCLSGLLR